MIHEEKTSRLTPEVMQRYIAEVRRQLEFCAEMLPEWLTKREALDFAAVTLLDGTADVIEEIPIEVIINPAARMASVTALRTIANSIAGADW